MEVVTLVMFYVIGVITGVAGLATVTIYVGKRALNKRKLELESYKKKEESIDSRMKKVKEITEEQLDLQGHISTPQKNALHGRHKNGLIDRVKELEEQKNEILKSIIADGYDPVITAMNEVGVVSTIKLSEFLAQTGIKVPSKKSEPPKKTSKFIIYKGGKDDDDGNTVH